MELLIGALAISLIFYIFLPGISAFSVRARWRKFRKNLVTSRKFPILSYERLRSIPKKNRYFRFFGVLEAIQGEHSIWLRSGRLSIPVILKKTPIFISRGNALQNQDIRNNLKIVYWERIGALPEGTQFFVSGELNRIDGQWHFDDKNLLVIIHYQEEGDLLAESMWAGRQRNEYWNDITPASLLLGSLFNLVVVFVSLQSDATVVLISVLICLTVIPFVVLFPPGVFFFLLYRRFWTRGRELRAERDLLFLVQNACETYGTKYRRWAKVPQNNQRSNGENDFPELGDDEPLLRIRRSSLSDSFRLRPILALFGVKDPSWSGVSPLVRYYGSSDGSVQDPMVEELLVEGIPEVYVKLNDRAARVYELLSLMAFGLGLGINTVLIYIVVVQTLARLIF